MCNRYRLTAKKAEIMATFGILAHRRIHRNSKLYDGGLQPSCR